ncbi:hypothetical protein RIF23_03225 [Lipingzhangella sp. LS1_29]|uniref:Uncharacterized protein n=1 Tax=Lipingzhangella rawalii TaxID=2055835 RepID=A0ABU2H1X4_9ACTN|nr:hypothetical protein [Lipingzhangella rawalii]MDS1269305.1 hypothetical protein [Lipingzhangella rawalii]
MEGQSKTGHQPTARPTPHDGAERHHRDRWGDLPLNAIHAEDIAVWVAQLQKPRDEGGATLGASQTCHAHAVLSMILG